MPSFSILSDTELISEDTHDDRIYILQKLQRGLANNLGLNVSMRSLMNFFGSYHSELPSEDDEPIRRKLKDLGYQFGGGYQANRHFWEPLITHEEYLKLLPVHPADMVARDQHSSQQHAENEEERVRQGGLRGYLSRKAGDYLARKSVEGEPPSRFEKAVRRAGYTPRPLSKAEQNFGELRLRGRLGAEDEEYGAEITPEDYHEWMRVIHAEAADRGINLNNKRKFEDVAFFVVDNDAKLDMLGPDERTKRQIVSTLWRQHLTAPTAQQRSIEDEEMSPRDNAHHEGQAACIDHYHGIVRGTPRNPYAKNSRRHADWQRGFDNAEKGMWMSVGRENEEEDTSPNEHHEMKTYELVWKDGTKETVTGTDIAHAFARGGYSTHMVNTLDYYKQVKDSPPA